MIYKIKINREKCKSGLCNHECVKLCPSNWRILDDKKTHAIRVKIRRLGNNKKAMEACPFNAISIVELSN